VRLAFFESEGNDEERAKAESKRILNFRLFFFDGLLCCKLALVKTKYFQEVFFRNGKIRIILFEIFYFVSLNKKSNNTGYWYSCAANDRLSAEDFGVSLNYLWHCFQIIIDTYNLSTL